ncbi:MAG: hypothetical protein QGI33_02375 [Candidatus Brocadiia bacterium]|nr:hypothetical protein [Candidatus Brocadiia bacterium]
MRFVPPRSRRAHLAGIIGALGQSLRHRPSRLGACLHRAAELFRRRGLVLLFSDLRRVAAEDVRAAIRVAAVRVHAGTSALRATRGAGGPAAEAGSTLRPWWPCWPSRRA